MEDKDLLLGMADLLDHLMQTLLPHEKMLLEGYTQLNDASYDFVRVEMFKKKYARECAAVQERVDMMRQAGARNSISTTRQEKNRRVEEEDAIVAKVVNDSKKAPSSASKALTASNHSQTTTRNDADEDGEEDATAAPSTTQVEVSADPITTLDIDMQDHGIDNDDDAVPTQDLNEPQEVNADQPSPHGIHTDAISKMTDVSTSNVLVPTSGGPPPHDRRVHSDHERTVPRTRLGPPPLPPPSRRVYSTDDSTVTCTRPSPPPPPDSRVHSTHNGVIPRTFRPPPLSLPHQCGSYVRNRDDPRPRFSPPHAGPTDPTPTPTPTPTPPPRPRKRKAHHTPRTLRKNKTLASSSIGTKKQPHNNKEQPNKSTSSPTPEVTPTYISGGEETDDSAVVSTASSSDNDPSASESSVSSGESSDAEGAKITYATDSEGDSGDNSGIDERIDDSDPLDPLFERSPNILRPKLNLVGRAQISKEIKAARADRRDCLLSDISHPALFQIEIFVHNYDKILPRLRKKIAARYPDKKLCEEHRVCRFEKSHFRDYCPFITCKHCLWSKGDIVRAHPRNNEFLVRLHGNNCPAIKRTQSELEVMNQAAGSQNDLQEATKDRANSSSSAGKDVFSYPSDADEPPKTKPRLE